MFSGEEGENIFLSHEEIEDIKLKMIEPYLTHCEEERKKILQKAAIEFTEKRMRKDQTIKGSLHTAYKNLVSKVRCWEPIASEVLNKSDILSCDTLYDEFKKGLDSLNPKNNHPTNTDTLIEIGSKDWKTESSDTFKKYLDTHYPDYEILSTKQKAFETFSNGLSNEKSIAELKAELKGIEKTMGKRRGHNPFWALIDGIRSLFTEVKTTVGVTGAQRVNKIDNFFKKKEKEAKEETKLE